MFRRLGSIGLRRLGSMGLDRPKGASTVRRNSGVRSCRSYRSSECLAGWARLGWIGRRELQRFRRTQESGVAGVIGF